MLISYAQSSIHNLIGRLTGLAPLIGEIRCFTGSAVPEGWMVCEGQTLAVSAYPELFAVLADRFGGNGVSTFALPCYRSYGPTTKLIYTGVDPTPVLLLNVPAAIAGPVSGDYSAGQTLSFAVHLLDDMAITGGPVALTLSIGAATRSLAFISGSARLWAFADYSVQAEDVGEVSVSLNLNGAVLSSNGTPAALSVHTLMSDVVIQAA